MAAWVNVTEKAQNNFFLCVSTSTINSFFKTSCGASRFSLDSNYWPKMLEPSEVVCMYFADTFIPSLFAREV